ncbi:FAD-dependent oxidoreductase [Pseudonocardia spinosispora]|uniref:FAD-dependent oxidoreductase n=1 Tax=Pseudonocardia spinosispora TaxID=103441 RepID=UPI00048AAD06|nr:FAD-dependent oxidoreductase [Pseudonocardia spinosispora]
MNVAVVGAGVVGLATSSALLDAGARVSCFEAEDPMSQRSAGSSRVFRLAHAEPELVSLAMRARERYREWSELAGRALIGSQTTMFASSDAPRWAAAMRTAGAEVEIPDPVSVPVPVGDAPVLVDPAGGVVDVTGVGEFLVRRVGGSLVERAVRWVELSGDRVLVDGETFDACVIVAGAGTASLAAQVGLSVPDRLARHCRFTFAVHDPGLRPPCVLDRSEHWRAGFTSYQHLTAPGRWAVGGHLAGNPVETDQVSRQGLIDAAREFTSSYVRESLPWCDPEPVEELYCDSLSGWGDGYVVQRAGAVVALHGDNLFKLAPVLGDSLAAAVVA